MKWIGIDPGIKGAISIIEDGKLFQCIPFPSFKELSVRGRNISRPDIPKLVAIFEKMSMEMNIDYVMIEKQVAMPGQNAVGTFNTGKGYGILLALITVFFRVAKVDIVGCKEWQEAMITDRTPVQSKLRREKRKQLKADSVTSAQELFSDFDFKKSKRSTVDNDGMTDSALIAYYCYTKHNGKS